MNDPADVGEAALRLAVALSDAGLPFAFGGALALAAAGYVRATVDVDVDVFVEPPEYERLLDVLAGAGCGFDRAMALEQARDGSTVVVRFGPWRVDVFVPTIPFYAEARRRAVLAPLLGRPTPFLDAESLAVFKLLFDRPKDILDLERLAAVLGPGLDHAWVRSQVVDMMGEEDVRVHEWARIVRDFVVHR